MSLVPWRCLKTGLKVTAIFSLVIFVSLFQNCSKANFSASADNSSSSGGDANGLVHVPGSCHAQLLQANVPIKVLFVVDMSGSNFGEFFRAGTDPDRRVRSGSIQTFFDDYKAKPNFNWGFVGFRGSQAFALINNGNMDTGQFSANQADMSAALSTFNGMYDSGLTPYKAALTMAAQIIRADTLAASDTKYIVVFLSDGMPTDYPPGNAGDKEMTDDVSALTSILPGRVSFNTIYYGEVDASASGRLKDMSIAGGGEFLDTNNNPTGKSFYIADYINIPGVGCQ